MEKAAKVTASKGKQTRAGSKRKAEGENSSASKKVTSIVQYYLIHVVSASGSTRMMQEQTGNGYSASASDGSMKTAWIMKIPALCPLC